MTPAIDLTHLWNQGDVVTKIVTVLLLLMSVASWLVIVLKSFALLSQRRAAAQMRGFWQANDLAAKLRDLADGEASTFQQLALATHQHTQGARGLEHRLKNLAEDDLAERQSGLAVLASIGSTAPFVGLLGTVWGIHHALLVISAQGQVSIDQVAGPIGEALIMTALGLAVAIPAVLGYNALLRVGKARAHQVSRFAGDLHAFTTAI